MTVRGERLDHLIADLSALVDDLAEFLPGEFDDSGNLLDQVVQTLQPGEVKQCRVRDDPWAFP